jgi:hypothetical protein
MADDLGNIEIGVVFRDRGDGMKKAVTTAERLERQLEKLVKAANQGSVSQERFNQKLIVAGRELKKNSDMTGNQAYGAVVKYTNALKKQITTQDSTTKAINNTTRATERSTEATKRNIQNQMAATKANKNLGVVTQQAGYQVSDFVVQVQSGTNPLIAFSQQASQLVGVLPLVAERLGLTTKAAIALSAGLGVAIPLVSVAAMIFLNMRSAAEEAEEAADDFADSMNEISAAAKKLEQAMQLNYGSLELITEKYGDMTQDLRDFLELQQELAKTEVTNKVSDAFSKLINTKEYVKVVGELGGLKEDINQANLDLVQAVKDGIDLEATNELRKQISELENQYNSLSDSLENMPEGKIMALSEEFLAAQSKGSIVGMQEALTGIRQVINELPVAARQSLLPMIVQMEGQMRELSTTIEKTAQLDPFGGYGESNEVLQASIKITNDIVKELFGNTQQVSRDFSILNGTQQKVKDDMIALFEVSQSLTEEIGQAGKEALILAGVDITKPIDDATKSAAELVTQLGISLGLAEKLVAISAMGPERAKFQARVRTGVLPPQARGDFDVQGGETPYALQKYLDDVDARIKAAEEAAKKAGAAFDKTEREAERLRKELEGPMVNAIGSVSDAFGDFIARGLTDFKDFVKQILGSFQNMIAQMIAMAVKNRIMLSLGIGGVTPAAAAAGEVAGLGSASTMLGSFGTGAGLKGLAGGAGFLGGVGNSLAAFSGGIGAGFGASFSSLGTLFSGGASVAAGGAGYAATLGAALPAIVAVAAVVGLLTKKTKLLDSGLRTTIEGFDVAIETFQLTQSSRLFGLLKGRKKLGFADAPAEVADPLIEAIGDMQQSIVDAAGTLGIGADAFDDFSYQFKLSLKGLTEEEQLQKINEEITKMGDSFASLSGHFETMNELLAAATQRYDIETRLLGLLNDQSALLTRQRERERAATHELNRGMLDQVYALEDAYSAVNSAFATVQRSIEARKNAITNSFNEIMETIQARIDAANENVSASRGILSSLEGASGGSGMTRGAGMAYLRSLRGASRITDQKKLDDALQAIADPSQDLYTNFVDYQRDFQDQTNLVRELEEKAALQLSTDEQTLLQLQEEATAAQERYNEQMENLDEQLLKAQEQLDALMGIDKSVQSVEKALGALGNAISGAMAAQKAAAKAAAEQAASTGGGATGKSFSEQYGTGSQYKGYDLAKLSGSGDLLNAAAMLGVGTSGKTGAQIQQEVSNASGMAVRLDNATRSQQFAMGGMFGGGFRMVGERGPEIEATGPSRIFSTKQTAELFRNPELVEEVRSLRAEVAGLRSESRQLQASNSKYVKRNYDINRKWDTEGLPATRT